jgi:hypothetical protein
MERPPRLRVVALESPDKASDGERARCLAVWIDDTERGQIGRDAGFEALQ